MTGASSGLRSRCARQIVAVRPFGLAAVALACVATWIIVAWLVSPGIVYAKLQWDAAVYLAQARHLWTMGSASEIVLGDGLAPIVYSPLTAYVRAPLFGLTDDPATLVRLVQVENVALLALLGCIASLYMALRLPPGASRKWLAAPWIILTLTYNPWALNLVLPLGDHVYAVLTMSVLLLAVEPVAGVRTHGSPWRLVALGILAGLAMVQKFTSLALLPAVLLPYVHSSRVARLLLVPVLVTVAVATWLGRGLFAFYIQGAFQRYLDGRSITEIALNTLTNLIVAALPNQIVPNFSYLFHRDFGATHAVLFSDLSSANAMFALLGCALTALIVAGAWIMRRTMSTELIFVLAVVPVYAIVSNSTARYLSSVQPVLLVWLIAALSRYRQAWCATPIKALPVKLLHSRWSLAAAGVVAACIIVSNLTRSFTARRASTLSGTKHFLDSLSTGFERGRNELAKLQRANPDLQLLDQADDIRWYAIAGIGYVSSDRVFTSVCAGRAAYAVFACDIRNCARLSAQLDRERAATALLPFDFESVYRDDASWGRFDIERIRLRRGSVCRLDPP